MSGAYAAILGTLRSTFRFGPKTAPQTFATAASAARTATFPDKSGTVAYTSDLSAGPGEFVVVRKTADQSVTSSTAYVDDDTLQLSIDVNEIWLIDYSILATGNSSGDIKFALNVPSGATGWFATQSALITTATATNADTVLTWTTDLTDGANFATAVVTGQNIIGSYRAMIVNGANAGTVKFRWAQNASNATATTVKAGSFLRAERIYPPAPLIDVSPVTITKGAEFKNNGNVLVAAEADVTYVYCPFGGVITKAIAYGTAGGSCVFDVYKGAYGSTTSITASQPPTLTADDYMENSTLAGWTTSVAAGEWLGFKLVSSSTQLVAGCVLEITPS